MKEIGLYIHIPFCVAKCIYCDFLSGPADYDARERYVKALCGEIENFAKEEGRVYEVKTVFFGGGTPSVLENELMEQILSTISKNFQVKRDCEFTIECNPGTVNYDKLRLYKDFGVNRLSFGLQSADDDELKRLGRIHSFSDFLESYELALRVGFNNINVDIMSGLMNQTVESYLNTLNKVLPLKPAHISAYSLIIEEGTPLYSMYSAGNIVLPDEETERQMYYDTLRILSEYGYHRYEISNYAMEGHECRHNITYWRRGEYKGFGVGAASLLDNIRYANTSDMKEYLAGVKPVSEILTVEDCMAEFAFLGLRMMRGIDTEEFYGIFNRDFYDVYGDVVAEHTSKGLLNKEGSRIKLTEKGIDVSNYVFSDFLLT